MQVMANGSLSRLREARTGKGWTQSQAATRLRVSQGYLSLLERGLRAPSERLRDSFAKVYGLDLGASGSQEAVTEPAELAKRLATLGYEPLAYLKGRAVTEPARLLAAALSTPDLDARLVEALPWVALNFPDLDWNWLLDRSKRNDLQNRLGYVVTMARELAEGKNDGRTANRLLNQERTLERSILLREDTLCHDSMTRVERNWLLENRPEQAKRWRVLTDLRREHLPYAA
jgi:transcriptional regulator with XRE-family HTH domain